ncbi:hypothetical protein DYB32_007410 [Aphanomyces invadans]|uniref:ABC transporter domain-containing protein n=1 Tax=Aphanomyces invadans TaxID=157072 RepID=A0A3R6V763_9STRA|nr:hypothetical protein DYB32_007410 [Aphanomyces invadans]
MNNRSNRIVVLTTHFMDEADILGDRIAIMAEGELRCCGSSLFLKNRYGAGYNFSLVKADSCDTNELVAFVNSRVGGRAKILSNVGTEIAFQLPLDCSPLFGAMFADLDEQMELLGVVSYGISVTTMEEVFIKVAELGDESQQHTLAHKQPKSASPVSPPHSGFNLLTERASGTFRTHFVALWKKRYRIAKRDRRVALFGMVLPILFLVLGIALLKTSTLNKNEPKMALSVADYPRGNQTPIPFSCQSDWLCDAVPQYAGAAPYDLQLPMTPLPSPSNAFGIQYTALTPTMDTCLRASSELWTRGFKSSITGQYGGLVLFGSAASRLFGYNVAVNTTAKHSAAVHKAIADEALYRAVVNRPDVTLKVSTHPLPLTDTSKVLFSAMVGYLSSFFAILAFAIYTASVVPHLVKEKHAMSNAKHQQLISGVSLTAFWLANFAWDLAMFAVPCASGLAAIYLFDISAFSGRDCASCTDTPFAALVVLFVLLGGALIAFCYIVSFALNDPASSQVYIIMVQMFVGLMLTIVSLVLDIVESTRATNKALKFIWRLSPLFCIGNGLNAVSSRTIQISRGLDPRASAFSTDVMGWDIIYLGIEAIVFPIAAIAIDHMRMVPSLHRPTKDGPTTDGQDAQLIQDEDVAAEERRVARGAADSEAIVLRQLRKVYDGGKVGVASVSLGLPKGECFGYLGINGAGKTTTMKMLTGDIVASSGSATLGGFDMLSQQLDVRRLIGYCPQFDALIDLLTVREHLELFACIKGIPSNLMHDTVVGLMDQMNLNDFEHKLAGTLSGGNKRKLSVAIAMIGSPPIIFLDEPSTGMDPVSRRFMWDVIADISTRSKESTILLTTHSMEECEALCTRVGIMVGGGLRCLGSIQHLKHRFGDGLSLHVKASPITQADIAPILTTHFAATSVLHRDDLASVCAALGRPGRVDAVSMGHPTGYVVEDALATNGFVRTHDFCAWWLGEDNYDLLKRYLETVFGVENVQLVERQHDVSRFKLLGHKDRVALSHVFPLIERAKRDLHIQDYTVSQTTLEQIFNGFAAQQTQEKGVARGLEVVEPTSATHDDRYRAHTT